MHLLSAKVSPWPRHDSVSSCSLCLLNRKIRCNGGEPCANCAKTGRNCDYTPVPADSSAPRRRRAFGDNDEPSIVQKETSREGSLASRGGGSTCTVTLPESSQPAGPFATGTNPPFGIVDPNAYLQQPIGLNETGLLPSGFSYVPPSHGAQQMEWALVPVWRSSGPETAPHQLLAPPPGFSASRMAESTPSITIPQSNEPRHTQGEDQVQGISRSISANRGAQYQHFHPGPQPFAKVFGFAANQIDASMSGPEPTQSRSQPTYNRSASEDPRYKDTPMSISDMGVSAQRLSYPRPSPSTGTSFSSNHDFASSSTSQTGNQSLSSPPYTPLPSTSIGSFASRPSTANMAHGPSMEEMKQAYPPVMFMHMPPVTPAFEPVNQGPYRSNMLGPDAGMVGLGIMMPGM